MLVKLHDGGTAVPVTETAICPGEPGALFVKVMVPVRLPELDGVAVTASVHDTPGFRLAVPVEESTQPENRNSPDEGVIAPISRRALPVLLTVTDCGGLVCPTGVGGKLRLFADIVIIG